MCSNVGDSTSSSDKFEKRFLRLAEVGIDCDCEFIVGSQNAVVKAHKFLFSAASEVFRAMFYGELREDNAVKIEDLEPEGFEGMKHFIYTGELNFTSAIHALSTYIAARKYLISQLIKECTKFIEGNLQPSEVLEFYEYCKIHNIAEFQELCFEIIQNKTDDVVESKYFEEAEMDTIELILKSPSLNLNSEIEVFNHFERWALAEVERKKISVEERASSFNSLKKHIRFLTISAEELCSKVSKSLLLSSEEKLAVALNQLKSESQPMPENLSHVQEKRNFTHSKSKRRSYPFEQTLMYIIRDSEQSYSLFADSHPDIGMYIYCKKMPTKDIVYFRVSPYSRNSNNKNQLWTMRTKLRVIAEKSCDDLFFQNECKLTITPENNQHHVTFAYISASILNDARFLRGTGSAVTFVLSYDLERIA